MQIHGDNLEKLSEKSQETLKKLFVKEKSIDASILWNQLEEQDELKNLNDKHLSSFLRTFVNGPDFVHAQKVEKEILKREKLSRILMYELLLYYSLNNLKEECNIILSKYLVRGFFSF